MEWGNISEILNAITAILALIAAVFAAWFTKGQLDAAREQQKATNTQLEQMQEQLDIEHNRDRKQQESDEKEHASHVTSWIESHNYNSLLVIQNNSESPVYDVEVKAKIWKKNFATGKSEYPVTTMKTKIVPPGKYIFVHVPTDAKTIVDLSQKDAKRQPTEREISNGWTFGEYYEDTVNGRPILGSSNWRVLMMTFKDTANKTWIRDDSGLHR
ncbi:hypothetical protein HF984_10615 [Rothia terrae]|uniref:Uncharacterized protein n=1 Tax=Rothia terrae TaxID=396015 RepID=A0A7H2BBH4_9MICC|nr:hypothetical protein [Rothia terrae]MDT0190183.1 hypothetical protein [Rothia terrae]NKZ35195.1 hypothetical protein [Rothia terrae]QNV37020.1 hypothetical protein IDM49_07040 [Rothia terrae]